MVKILTWNIQWGLGMDGRCDLGRIVREARAMADFDVLCLQELSDGMPDLKACPGGDQFAEMAALLPGFTPVDGVAVDVPGEGGRRRRWGNMILSRLPVGQVLRYTLPWEADATPNMPRILIDAVVAAPWGPLRVMTTHLEWSSPRLRAAQVEGIREAQRSAAARAATPPSASYGPFIPQPGTASAVLTGDFNMRPEDPSKRRIEEPLPDGAPALRDAWTAVHGEAPHPPSFCIVDQSFSPPHCCDFVFVSEDLVPRIAAIDYFTETRASDHQPALLTLAG
ncbi:MAG: endonuclease/exonuclease/phosphatase family protein [Alsobacter sp.]